MGNHVASLHVSATETFWNADEVPRLTASTLHRFEPAPDPVIPKTALRRFKRADVAAAEAGRQLNTRELAQMDRICKAAGLPALPTELVYSKWGEYLQACNDDADARGWWAGLIPPRDPYLGARVAWVNAAEEHRKLLRKAIAQGQIQASMAGTMVPAPSSPIALDRLVLTRDALQRFCDVLAIELVVVPHFVSKARPLSIDSALSALPESARVSYEENFAGGRSQTSCTAGEYREIVLERIDRQSQGYFTLDEAAQVLAESRPGLDPRDTVTRFRRAHLKGELRIHQRGSRFPLEVHETVRDFWDTVEVSELDTWLRASVGYGFPMARASQPSAAPAAAIETPKQRRARLLKMHDAEISAGGARGALARVTEIEKRTRPTADRSNIGKEIRKAREERQEQRRGGVFDGLAP